MGEEFLEDEATLSYKENAPRNFYRGENMLEINLMETGDIIIFIFFIKLNVECIENFK